MSKLNYEEARNIGKTPLSKLITEKLVSGEGIGKSFTSSIGEKFSARRTRMKETFDPLNIMKFLTGGSNVGPALLGRLLGRDVEDITHFTSFDKKGKGSRSQNTYSKVDQKSSLSPFYTKLGPGTPLILKTGDSVSDIVSKIYRLMRTIYDKEEKQTKKELKALSAAAGASVFSGLDKGLGALGDGGEDGSSGLPSWLSAALPLLFGALSGPEVYGESAAVRAAARGLRPKTPTPPKESTRGKITPPKSKSGKPPQKYSKVSVEERAKKYKKSQLTGKNGKQLTGAALKSRLDKLDKTKASKATKVSKVADRFKKLLGLLNSIESQIPDSVKKVVGKTIGFVGKGAVLWPFGFAAKELAELLVQYGADNDDEKLKREGSKVVGGLVTSFAGAGLGEVMGSLVGRLLGMVVPIPGMSFAGGVAGSYFGAMAGEKVGELAAATIIDNMDLLDKLDENPKINIPPEAMELVQTMQDASTAGSMWGDYVSGDIEDLRTSVNTGLSGAGETLTRMYNDFMTTQDQYNEFQGTGGVVNSTNNNVVSGGGGSGQAPVTPAVRHSALDRPTRNNFRAIP